MPLAATGIQEGDEVQGSRARYLIGPKIGAGSFGVVYRATDVVSQDRLAIKVLKDVPSADPTLRDRFDREAGDAQRAAHPRTVVPRDHGLSPANEPFLVYDFVEGPTLREVIAQNGQLSPFRAARIAIGIAEALAHAHSQSVIHHDLKPENVLLPPDLDGNEQVKVVDFGVSKMLVPEGVPRFARTAVLLRSPHYTAPEQIDPGVAGPSSDVYALGLILYEMLTGRPPFAGGTPAAVVLAHLRELAPPFKAIRPDLELPPELEMLVMRALEKSPERRFRTAAEMAAALLPFGEAPPPKDMSSGARTTLFGLDIDAAWDRPARPLDGMHRHFARVRIRGLGESLALPLNAVVLLDVSTSMANNHRLDRAVESIEALWSSLADGDSLRVMTFSRKTRTVLDWAEKGKTPDSDVRKALATCHVEGVTLLSHALESGIAAAMERPSAQPRFVWLVTDGTPTDGTGNELSQTELAGLVQLAGLAANEGVSVGAFALGDAEEVDVPFLRKLADVGRGAFVFAPDGTSLGAELKAQLGSAKRVVASGSKLEVTLDKEHTLVRVARVTSTGEIAPVDRPKGTGRWSIPLGPLATPETIVLLEIATGPSGGEKGRLPIGRIQATAFAAPVPLVSAELRLELDYTPAGSRALDELDPEVDALRRALDATSVAEDDRLDLGARITDLLMYSKRLGDRGLEDRIESLRSRAAAGDHLTADEKAILAQAIRRSVKSVFSNTGPIGRG